MIKSDEKKDDISKDEENKDSTKDTKTPSKPLLPKSAILKLLAELVKSYAGVSQLVTEYSHNAKLSSASEVSGNFSLGNFSKGDFERCRSTGSELLSLLICHNSSKFLLLSVYGLINCPRIDTVHFWLTCVAQKRLCLSSLLCTKLFLDTVILIVFGFFNPKFNIYIQILRTELHTFPYSRTPITQTPF